MQEQDFLTQSAPLSILNQWIQDAQKHSNIREPSAASISTLSEDLKLSTRVVLIKNVSSEGLTFYTNYNSAKGRDLDAHPQCSGAFYWDALARQVRFAGRVQKTSREQSETYWKGRSRESQLSQYISQQSEPVLNRATLEKKWEEAERTFRQKEIPCPVHWGGYLIQPDVLEFWTGLPGRLHDRFQFLKTGPHWTCRRLYP